MKQLLLISRCPPYPLHLGDRLIIWHLCRQLQARGWAIDLLALTDRAEDRDEIDHYRHLFRSVRLFDDPARSPASYLRRLLLKSARFPDQPAAAWSPELWQAVHESIHERDYDAVHLFGGVQVYEYSAALAGKAAIITPYESFSLYLKRAIEQGGGLGARLRRLIARGYERFMFTPYHRTVVVAGPDRDELLGINPQLPVEVIPNGIDLDAFQPCDLPREAAALLFTGNYEYAPNLDAALTLIRQVFPAVQAVHPEAQLWIVGNGPPPELLSLASDSVHVTGRVDDVRDYLARATVFVCPLRLGAGIKNKVLEALAMRLPVIATPLSVDGIDVQDGREVLLHPVDAMAQAVITLLNDPAQQAALGDAGQRLIEAGYSWASVADRYEALYEGLQHPKN